MLAGKIVYTIGCLCGMLSLGVSGPAETFYFCKIMERESQGSHWDTVSRCTFSVLSDISAS